MKKEILKLKNYGHIQFVTVLLLIAVLVYILDHQLPQFAWELDGGLAESKNNILNMKMLEMNLLDAH